MSKILIFIVLVLAIVGGWWYFSGSKTTMTDKANPATVTTTTKTDGMVSGKTIEIKDFKYAPGTLTVKAGEKVNVTNMDSAGHSVTADDGSFDSGIVSSGTPGTFTAPTKPGTYAFHCIPHPSIVGTLVVE